MTSDRLARSSSLNRLGKPGTCDENFNTQYLLSHGNPEANAYLLEWLVTFPDARVGIPISRQRKSGLLTGEPANTLSILENDDSPEQS